MDFFVGGTEAEKNGSNSRSLCGELWVEINRTYAIESEMKERIDILVIPDQASIFGMNMIAKYAMKPKSNEHVKEILLLSPVRA